MALVATAGTRSESRATPRPDARSQDARKATSESGRKPRKGTLHSADRVPATATKEAIITRAVRVELVAPVGESWDDIGPQLRRYRAVIHHIYNDATLGALLEKQAGVAIFKLDGSSRTYQMAKVVAERFNLGCCGGLLSAVSREVDQKIGKWLKDKRRNRPPFYKLGAPIPVRTQESDVYLENNRVLIRFKLAACGHHVMRVAASRGSHWTLIRRIATGGVKRGAMKLVYDERSRKWYAIISYSEPTKPVADGVSQDKTLIVHRGQHNWLTVMTSDGMYRVLARGNKYRAQRRHIELQRKQRRKTCQDAERGSGAKGHGRKRRLQEWQALGDKLDRLNRTTCQQLASAVIKTAIAYGCGRVVIEDYGGIEPSADRAQRRFIDRFPLYQLKQSIVCASQRHGIVVDEVLSLWISSECPRCGHVSRSAHNRRTGIFHCPQCGFDRPADFVAVLHMAREAGVSQVWDERLQYDAAIAEAMRKGSASENADLEEVPESGSGASRKPPRKGAKSRRSSEGRRKP